MILHLKDRRKIIVERINNVKSWELKELIDKKPNVIGRIFRDNMGHRKQRKNN
jgi:hypothetical protein